MNKYEELQAAHQHLLEQSEEVEDPKEILEDVQAYIEQIKADAEFVPDARERNQLRANLRYWASFVYDQTGTYPNTNMRPASIPSTAPDRTQPFPQPGKRTLFTAASIIVGFLIIFMFTFGYNALIFTPQRNTEATQVAEINAQNTQVAQTAVETGLAAKFTTTPTDIETDLPLIPLTGRSQTPIPPTITASPTPKPTATQVIPLATQTITPTLDPTAIDLLKTEVAYYSATDIVLLPATGGGGPPTKTYMTASLKFTGIPAKNCGVRTLTIALDPIDLFSGSDLGALVQLSQGGKVVAAAQLPFQKGTVTFTLPNSTSNAAVLVQVDHPLFLFETVIAQFYADCSRNRLFLYYRPDLDKEYSQTDPSNLQLSWRMSTWGPSPDLKSWIATLLLVARGGDGNYIFWASGDAANAQEDGLLLDNRLLVSKEFCDPAQLRLGVTSAGLTTKRDMVLQAPVCIQISPTPTP